MLVLLRAVALSAWREIRTLNSIQGNNFFWFALLLSMQPESMGLIWSLIGSLLLLPALAAPLARIPEIRLSFWPLGETERKFLRWLAKPEVQSSPWLWRLLPLLEFRQIMRTLDFWLATLFAAMGTAYRLLYPNPEPAAFPILAMLVVLALSTLAQNLLGLDGLSGRMRWKMAPSRGYRILWRKGWVLIAITVALTAGLSPLAALSGMLAALAIGHHSSALSPLDCGAWRFSMGQFFPLGFMQVIGMFSCGIATARGDWVFLGLSVTAYLVSIFVYGWVLENA